MSGQPVAETRQVAWWPFPINNPRAKRALDVAAVGMLAWRGATTARSWVRTRTTYRVSLDERDDLYPAVHGWLTERVDPAAQRSIAVATRRSDELRIASPGDPPPAPPELRRRYDGAMAIDVTIGGHPVSVMVEDGWSNRRIESFADFSSSRHDRIVFTCRGVTGREAVLAWLDGLIDRTATHVLPRLYVARWGSWERGETLSARPLDSVVVTPGLAERLVADLRRFVEAESEYERLGIPWHRGILFEGPPGSGKTSLARALADTFGLDVYLLPLADLHTDAQLLSLVATVPGRAMLLLEDIDCVSAATERVEGETDRATMSGLLNALDGVATPHGLIMCMTTNRPERIDEALIRPGRADVHAHVGYLDGEMLVRLAEFLGGAPVSMAPLDGAEVTAAEIVGVAKPHLGDPPAVRRALAEWVPATRSAPDANGSCPSFGALKARP